MASMPTRAEYQLLSWVIPFTWLGSGKAPQIYGLNAIWLQPKSGHGLVEVVEATEQPNPEIGSPEHVEPGIDVGIDRRAVLLDAERGRVRIEWRRPGEILVLETPFTGGAPTPRAPQETPGDEHPT